MTKQRRSAAAERKPENGSAAATKRIWESWMCPFCWLEHPPHVLVCSCVKPRESEAA